MSGEDPRLAALRDRLERTESELRSLGYRIDRVVTPSGSTQSGQVFQEEVLILVLFGRMEVRVEDGTAELEGGDQFRVAAGVPYTLRVLGETPVYWLQALRDEPDTPPS